MEVSRETGMKAGGREIRAVIFDMDGVIFDSERLYIDLWAPIAERDHIPDIRGTILACTGTTKEETWRIFAERYGEEFPMADYQREISAAFGRIVDEGKMPVKPGAREILKFLRARGIPAAIASSTRTDTVRRELDIAGLLTYFTVIVGGDMAERSKPAPDIFLQAAQRLGLAPGACAIIEDSFNGVRAAHRAGGFTIMVPDLRQPDEEIRRLADRVCASLLEVKNDLGKGGISIE